MNPTVSVIMPVYNAEKYLGAAIESILRQTFEDFELLLIDDGATDKSGEICDKYAAKDSRVRVFHQANAGRCRARNRGIEEACGQYIAFSDDDDEYEPNLLKDNVSLAIKHNADMVRFMRRKFYIGADGAVRAINSPKQTDEIYVFHGKEIYENIKCGDKCGAGVWACIFSKKFLVDNKIRFAEKIRSGYDDRMFCIDCYYSVPQKVVYNIRHYYNWYCRHGQSDSANVALSKIKDLTDVIECDYKLYRDKISDYNSAYWYSRCAMYINFYMIYILYAWESLSLKTIKERLASLEPNLKITDRSKILFSNIGLKKKIVVFLYAYKFYYLLILLFYIFYIRKVKNKTISI